MHIRLRAVKETSGVVCPQMWKKTSEETSGVVCGQVSTNYPRGRFISEAVFLRCHFQISPYVLIERVFIHDHRSALYTTGLMTKRTVYDTVNSKKEQEVRKGKAMLQTHANRMNNTYRLFDLQGTTMLTAKEAAWLINVCLHKTGSSGCLGPGASPRALE